MIQFWEFMPHLKSWGNSFKLKIIVVIISVWLAPFQCIALHAGNNLQSGLSNASLVASSTLRLWYSSDMRTSCWPFTINLRNCVKHSPGISHCYQVAKQLKMAKFNQYRYKYFKRWPVIYSQHMKLCECFYLVGWLVG